MTESRAASAPLRLFNIASFDFNVWRNGEMKKVGVLLLSRASIICPIVVLGQPMISLPFFDGYDSAVATKTVVLMVVMTMPKRHWPRHWHAWPGTPTDGSRVSRCCLFARNFRRRRCHRRRCCRVRARHGGCSDECSGFILRASAAS